MICEISFQIRFLALLYGGLFISILDLFVGMQEIKNEKLEKKLEKHPLETPCCPMLLF